MLESCGKHDIASKTYLKSKVFPYKRHHAINHVPNTANGSGAVYDRSDGPSGLCRQLRGDNRG
jgi:hypothetical protein